MKHVRMILIALLSGAAAGLVIGGIGSRMAMRLVADSIGRFPELTIDTLTVLLIGTILGMAGGFIFLVERRFLPASVFVQGLVLAATIFGIAGVRFFLRPIHPGDELALNPSLGRLLFSILFVVYGLTVPLLVRALDRYLPAEERFRTRFRIATLVLGVPGVLGIGLMIAQAFAD